MRRRTGIVPAVVVAVVVAGCTRASTPAPTTAVAPVSTSTTSTTTTIPATTTTRPPPTLSAEAAAFLHEAIDAVRTLSINRDRLDWDVATERLYRAADGAETTEDVYPVIRFLLTMVADGHSWFLTPGETARFDSGPASYEEPTVELGPDRIGRVSIGSYSGNVGPQADAFAAELATRIEAIAGDVCGWILDLRGNGGGNMWPMLAALSPLLTPGAVGAFTYPDGRTEDWTMVDGESRWRGETMTVSGVDPDGSKPVAVLVGRGTASSGEAVAVAFLGQPETRFFGTPTAGLTTSNEPVPLSDGSMLALTQSVFTDRTGRTFGQGVRIEPHEETDGEETVAAAGAWLAGTCGS